MNNYKIHENDGIIINGVKYNIVEGDGKIYDCEICDLNELCIDRMDGLCPMVLFTPDIMGKHFVKEIT